MGFNKGRRALTLTCEQWALRTSCETRNWISLYESRKSMSWAKPLRSIIANSSGKSKIFLRILYRCDEIFIFHNENVHFRSKRQNFECIRTSNERGNEIVHLHGYRICENRTYFSDSSRVTDVEFANFFLRIN